MKITYTITIAAALLLAAGCAHEERSYSTSETGYSSGHISEYNSQNNYSTPSSRSSYSAEGSQPTYSGSVGADGTYTPNATSDSTAAAGVYAGTQSDDVIVAQVRESLRQDPEIALIVPNLQISAHNGAIILNGHIQSEEQKRQILARVQSVTGVVTVNNQLNVMTGANEQNSNPQNSSGSQLNPTGSSSDSQRLYKDANGQDNSTNNVLNSTSGQNGQSQLYQQSNESGSALNPTSRTNGQSQMYQGSQQQNQSNMDQSSNSVNGADNSLSPTSRENGSSQIYQNNPGQNSQQSQSPQNQNTSNGQSTIQNQQ